MELGFCAYQSRSRETAVYPSPSMDEGATKLGFIYPAMGLAGETGEVLEKCKKVLRDSNGVFNREKTVAVAKEIGDVLWYVAQLCTELGLSMEACAMDNLVKLQSRKERGVLQGSGDDR